MTFKWVNVGSKDIAELLGVTERYVHDMVKDGKIPKLSHGLYDPKAVVQALKENHRNELADARGNRKKLSDIELEMETTKLKLLNIELGREERQVMNIEDVMRVMQEVLAALRNRLLALPKQLTSEIQGTAAQKKNWVQKAKRYTDELLNDLTRLPDLIYHNARGNATPPDGGAAPGVQDPDPAAGPHGKRVG